MIGTVYGGLNFFNPDTKTFSHLTTKNGLPSNTIHAIKKDASGYLWFTTDYNLYKFKFPDKRFILLNLGRTINTEFKTASFYPLQDGRWLTSTITEIICFRPERVNYKNTEPSKVEITGFRVFDDPLHIDSLLAANQPVKLNYKQNFLTIDFSLLNFSVLQQTKYYYQLSGVDKDWINVGTKNFASYTNLQPGKYIFSVKADNEISSNTSFKIIISPPFWERWWFILTLALLFAAILYWFYRYRIDQVFKLIQIRQRIATDLHDDIGSVLSSISIFSEVADKQLQQQSQQERTREVIGHISYQSRAMLEAMDDIVWAVNPKNDHFNDLAVRMREFAIPLLEARDISFDIDINADMQNTRIHMEARKNIFLIFKECINNIIKHADCTRIKVLVKKLNNQLEFMISDNGKGFDINQQSNRNGLRNMQKRATEMNGVLQVTSQPGNGTSIKLLVNII